jgi:hypothetical protein
MTARSSRIVKIDLKVQVSFIKQITLTDLIYITLKLYFLHSERLESFKLWYERFN